MKRSELYDRVWSTPVTKLGEEVGLSGSRIAAICQRHGIPTPPRGYWAKLSVGKQIQPPTLPQPEADYDIKLGAAPSAPRPGVWVAPGVLLRSGFDEGLPPAAEAAPPLAPAHQGMALPKRPQPHPPPTAACIDLELVRAAAAELQGIQAVRNLLQEVSSRAVHASPGDAQCVLAWTAAVREKLDEHDPVGALMRLVGTPARAARN